MERKQVVVTGLGTVNPLGHGVEDTWKALSAGRSGIDTIKSFDTGEYTCKIAGEVKDFDPTVWIDKKEVRKLGRFSQFALAGAAQAIEDASLSKDGVDPERVGIILGNGIGGFEVAELGVRQLISQGPRGVSPMTIPKLIINEGAANIAIRHSFFGPCYTVVTACTSATDAIGTALNSIRVGQIDVAISGGMEAAVTPFGISCFIKLTALSTKYNDRPSIASRPFDKGRDGFVMGEGAGILVLEEKQHALNRKARIYAEVAGYGGSCDAYHLTSPDAKGIGPARAMIWALKDAVMEPSQIDYLNAHGTSTPTNDPLETIAIKKAFGSHAYKMPISSTKSMTAHLIGGAGGLEAIISIMALREGFIPPTINLNNPDEGCDLDYVPHVGRKASLEAVMSDNLGFGGHNGALIFKKFKE
ncbi:3-oxoacyl-[acyl-carrier-protein] synthase, KASII [Olavius algarvensis spirochete endosymbiont]|uniref:beta-ketoacyl-ACP synthase II n=1 Tax=Olavius algarvensis spirochete endosymbiont TaxID=260710 RepID=UPI00052B96A5|nr:beta-ketoacyl-ACP synthase II [Olavius algarvensis spirochete endosymbiont]KGM38446.1 3-oxoacyl-ACP synthase [Alkalispirochaeta odontotermitis]VDA99398.1 3-oxoacyl-[acyl-carrier-protein] synthase, KASII [Olavius algarvensis spirochete endosymbiont]